MSGVQLSSSLPHFTPILEMPEKSTYLSSINQLLDNTTEDNTNKISVVNNKLYS